MESTWVTGAISAQNPPPILKRVRGEERKEEKAKSARIRFVQSPPPLRKHLPRWLCMTGACVKGGYDMRTHSRPNRLGKKSRTGPFNPC